MKKTIPKTGSFETMKDSVRNNVEDGSERLVILFDMDGVLVDVTSSYRKAIQETVRYFSGKKAQLKEIQGLKEKGGFNNDWDLTEAILISRGKNVPRNDIVEKFQELYRGTEEQEGFIEKEKWLLSIELLKRLKAKYVLGIVTGRPREEARFVLRKFDIEYLFDVVIAMEDYPPQKAKPDPYPINLALKRIGKASAIYVGDSVDDMIAAKRANIRSIGCISPGVSAVQLKELLTKNGATKILDDINDIVQALP